MKKVSVYVIPNDEILYGIDKLNEKADFNSIFFGKRKGEQNVGKKI